MRLQFVTLFAVPLIAMTSFLNGEEGAKDKKPPKDAKAPNYYPLQVGNSWHYRGLINGKKANITTQVGKTETVAGQLLAILEIPSMNLTEHLSQSDKGVFRHRFKGHEVTPPFCLLKYPATVGAKWEGEFVVVDKDADKHKYSAEIQKEEMVEVPAGKFKTIRVHVQIEEKDQTVKSTYWFAQDVGFVKQSFEVGGTLSILLELEKFERKK